jgi:hypothetical protein
LLHSFIHLFAHFPSQVGLFWEPFTSRSRHICSGNGKVFGSCLEPNRKGKNIKKVVVREGSYKSNGSDFSQQNFLESIWPQNGPKVSPELRRLKGLILKLEERKNSGGGDGGLILLLGKSRQRRRKLTNKMNGRAAALGQKPQRLTGRATNVHFLPPSSDQTAKPQQHQKATVMASGLNSSSWAGQGRQSISSEKHSPWMSWGSLGSGISSRALPEPGRPRASRPVSHFREVFLEEDFWSLFAF